MFNMPFGVTSNSHAIYRLHMTIFWVCVVIGCVVFSVILYSLIYHRKSSGRPPANFHTSLTVELIWTLIPGIILVAMAIPATQVLMQLEDSSEPTVNIKITGYQWKWEYEYLDYHVRFFSNLSTPQTQIAGQSPKTAGYLLEVDQPLVVPIHQKIRFLITANDVIHSWWVPAIGVKKDAIPGFIHDAWATIETPGTYRGQCAELCGLNHAYMPIVVVAKTPEEFQTWIRQQKEKINIK